MSEPMYAALGAVGAIVVVILLVLVASGGNFSRFGLAWRAFTKTARDEVFAAKVDALINPPPPPPPKPNPEPLRILALLQREGRIIDFLMTENIQSAADDQMAAAVKDLQPKWMAPWTKHRVLVQVMTQPENSQVEVPAGFDPSAIRVVGNVTGEPPFRGTLIHAGWRAREIK